MRMDPVVRWALFEDVDILRRVRDLHRQATVERSPYYVGRCVRDAIEEIKGLRKKLELKRGWSCKR
jgi:hypothetical protein